MAAVVADAKKDLESNDVDRMKSALEKLTAAGAEFYASTQAAAAATWRFGRGGLDLGGGRPAQRRGY